MDRTALTDTDASSSPPPGAWERLREATRDVHAAVEALPAMAALLDPGLSRERYVDVLRRHLALLSAWETRYHDWLDGLSIGWHYAWRTPRLLADLHALDIPAEAGSGQAIPDAPSAAERWGMLYVIEGSSLGGRLIARHVRDRRPELGAALSYFGPPAAPAWRDFQTRLQAALPDAASQRLAVGGARTMFGCFHDHLACTTR